MAYATQDMIQMAAGGAERLVQLADWDGDGAIDADVIAAAQAAADGWIDSYLRTHYATPIASPTETLRRMSAAECVYWMRCSRGMQLGDHDVEGRKLRTDQLLLMQQRKLLPDDPPPVASTVAKRAVFVDSDRDVSRENLKGTW